MKTQAGCTVPYVLDNDNICEDADKVKMAYNIHYTHITNQKNTCRSPCKYL